MMTSRRWKFVLCDDDDHEALNFREALNELGVDYELLYFGDPAELLDFMADESFSPDLVFLAEKMPMIKGMRHKLVTSAFVLGAIVYSFKSNEFDELKQLVIELVETDWEYPIIPRTSQFLLN